MSLKSAIKTAINTSQDKWRVIKVWPIVVDEPQYIGGSHTMLIEVSVTPRKSRKK